MPNFFTEEHEAFRKSVRTWVEKELTPHALEWDRAGIFPKEIFKQAGELGFLGISHDPKYGGSGLDYWYVTAFCEELVRSRNAGVNMALLVQSQMATPIINDIGTDEQKREFLAPALAGEKIAALGVSEPGAGSDLANLRTRADSIMLASRSLMPHPVENTWNTKLTLERERLLKEATIRNMINDPWYTLKYKAYSAVRLWVIGIQRGDFHKAGIAGKLRMLHATLYTGLILLLFLVLVPWAYRRGALSWRGTWPMLLLLAYVGLLHIPFTIQARYTTPVRLIMLALIAIALTRCVTGRSGTGSERPPA